MGRFSYSQKEEILYWVPGIVSSASQQYIRMEIVCKDNTKKSAVRRMCINN